MIVLETRVVVLLSFVSITVITSLAVIAAAIGWLPGARDDFIRWGMTVVLTEIVGTVILFIRQDWGNRLKLNIDFKNNLDPTDISIVSCEYKITDRLNPTKTKKGRLEPIRASYSGYWQVDLPSITNTSYSISLTFKDRNGDNWEIESFIPNVITKKAVKFE